MPICELLNLIIAVDALSEKLTSSPLSDTNSTQLVKRKPNNHIYTDLGVESDKRGNEEAKLSCVFVSKRELSQRDQEKANRSKLS